MSINKTTIRYILAGILLSVLIIGLYFTSVRRGENTNVHQPETPKTTISKLPVTTQSTLSVTKKITESEPDLIVSNKYVAKIDGKLVEAPMKNVSYKDKNNTKYNRYNTNNHISSNPSIKILNKTTNTHKE